MELTLQTIAADETRCGGQHGLYDVAGYVAVRTKFGQGKVEDIAVYNGATGYGAAIEKVHELRLDAEEGHYARCDVIYTDGCRGIC